MKETTRFKLFYATAFGCGLFILLTAIAMFFYVGGTAQDPTRTSYSFSFNFFSDLGRTQGFNGNSNLTSSVLFTTAAVLAGTGLIPYFQAIQEVIKGVTKRQRVWAKTGAILSVPVALAYGGIGLIPCNISYLGHMIMVGIAFLGSIPVLMANIFAFKNQKDFPVDLKRGYYVLISIIFLYLLINAFSLLLDSEMRILQIRVIGQKICVYAEMIWGVYEGLLSAKHLQKGTLRIPVSVKSKKKKGLPFVR